MGAAHNNRTFLQRNDETLLGGHTPKAFLFLNNQLMRSIVIGYSVCLSLVLPVISHAEVPSSHDQALDTLELLREEQLSTFELGEIVASSKQRFGPISRTYEVTAEDILNQNARNVGEALRFVQGIIYGQGGLHNEGSINIRGLGHRSGLSSFDKMYSVFIDGRPVLEPFLGTVDLANLPIDNVAKIKVIKGPAPAVFGPNNIGGVINIITKQGTPTSRSEATISYEEHNSQDYWLQHGGQKEQFHYYFAGSIRKTNGFPLASDFSSTPLQDNDDVRLQSDYEKYNLSVNLGYDFTPQDKIALLAGYYHNDFGIPPPTIGYKVFQTEFGRFTSWERYFVDMTGETQVSDMLNLKGKVYFDKFDNDQTVFTDQTFSQISTNGSTGGKNISIFDNYLLGTNLQATVQPTLDWTLKVGSFVRWDTVKRQRDTASSHERYETLTLDLFTETEFFLLDNLMLYAGINWDMLFTLNSFFDRTDESVRIDSISPLAGFIFKPWASTRFHATVGKRSNLPRMQNLYGRTAGNLDIDAEKVFSFEVGATQLFFNKRIEVETTFFYNDAEDIIELQDRSSSVTSAPGVTSFVEFANTDSFTTIGAEILAKLSWTEKFSTSVGYTYVNTDSEKRGGQLDQLRFGRQQPLDPDSPLLERPKHQVTLLANYESPLGIMGYLQGSYHSDSFDSEALFSPPFPNPSNFDHNSVVKVQSYFLLNGKLAYEVWKGVKPFIMVENILDSSYEAIRGFPQPGRRIFFGINGRL